MSPDPGPDPPHARRECLGEEDHEFSTNLGVPAAVLRESQEAASAGEGGNGMEHSPVVPRVRFASSSKFLWRLVNNVVIIIPRKQRVRAQL